MLQRTQSLSAQKIQPFNQNIDPPYQAIESQKTELEKRSSMEPPKNSQRFNLSFGPKSKNPRDEDRYY